MVFLALTRSVAATPSSELQRSLPLMLVESKLLVFVRLCLCTVGCLLLCVARCLQTCHFWQMLCVLRHVYTALNVMQTYAVVATQHRSERAATGKAHVYMNMFSRSDAMVLSRWFSVFKLTVVVLSDVRCHSGTNMIVSSDLVVTVWKGWNDILERALKGMMQV